MEITQCIECGGNVSTKAEACPHCGYRAEPQAALIICQECGRAFEPSLSSCPACGYPVAIEEGTLKNKADGRIKVPQSFTVLFCFLGVTFLGFLAGLFIRVNFFTLYAGAVIVQPWTLVSHSFFPVGGFMGWLNWAIPMVIQTEFGPATDCAIDRDHSWQLDFRIPEPCCSVWRSRICGPWFFGLLASIWDKELAPTPLVFARAYDLTRTWGRGRSYQQHRTRGRSGFCRVKSAVGRILG